MATKKNESLFTGITHSSLNADCKVKGEIVANTDIRIDGEWIGNITCTGKVIIGPMGSVTGNIQASNADIMGSLVGDIEIKNALSLKSTSKLEGNIITGNLSIEPGTIFNGKCEMALQS